MTKAIDLEVERDGFAVTEAVLPIQTVNHLLLALEQIGDTGFDKIPDANWKVPWHQDVTILRPKPPSSRLDGLRRCGLGFQQGNYHLSTPGTSTPTTRNASAGAEEKPGYRTKTVATRITPEELREVEIAAEREGKSLAEWLRDLALKAGRQRPADPMELLLSEQSATRYMLLNLFHATAQANAEGKHLLAESVLRIRDQADARKLADARKMIKSFHAQDAQEGQNGGQP